MNFLVELKVFERFYVVLCNHIKKSRTGAFEAIESDIIIRTKLSSMRSQEKLRGTQPTNSMDRGHIHVRVPIMKHDCACVIYSSCVPLLALYMVYSCH